MSKLPSIQFYPGDWRKDPGVQSLSYEERGIWLELLFLMHESESPGRLMLGGQPYPMDRLARLLGLSQGYLEVIITSLITLGVASRCDETGALMNRRMVRDRETSVKRSESGRKGGNPNFKKGEPNPYYEAKKDKQRDKQKITPSSSSSSSSSSSDNNTPLIPQGGGGKVEQDLFPLDAGEQTTGQTPDDFLVFWNEHDFVVEAKLMTGKRKQLLKKRLSDRFFMDHVDEAMEIASASRFLRGDATPSPGHKRFRLTIDWFLNEENFVKILEGQYNDQKPKASGDIKYYHPERQPA